MAFSYARSVVKSSFQAGSLKDGIMFPATEPSYTNDTTGLREKYSNLKVMTFNVGIEKNSEIHQIPCVCVGPAPSDAAAANTAGPLVCIHFKGNGYDLGEAVPEVRELSEALGGSVVCAEYPGSGSTATAIPKTIPPSEAVVDQIAIKLIDWCREKFSRPNIIISGRSIGCGPAIKLCKEQIELGTTPVKALVTMAGWTSFKDINAITRKMRSDAWNSLSIAPRITVPWCIIHGDNDGLVPFEHAQRLYESAPANSVTLVKVPGDLVPDGHSDFGLVTISCEMLGEIVSLLSPEQEQERRKQLEDKERSVQEKQPGAALLYCHGFNNTPEQIQERRKQLEDDARSVLQKKARDPNTLIAVQVAGWDSAAGLLQAKAEKIHSPIAGATGAPAYATDNLRAHHETVGEHFPPKGQPFYVVAHSRGCHIFLEWLWRHPERWDDLQRAALLHPDTPRCMFSDAMPEALSRQKARQDGGGFSSLVLRDRANALFCGRRDFLSLAKQKIGVFDTSLDFATSTSGTLGYVSQTGARDSTRDLTGLCAHEERESGANCKYSHSIWLDGDDHQSRVLSWLLGGA